MIIKGYENWAGVKNYAFDAVSAVSGKVLCRIQQDGACEQSARIAAHRRLAARHRWAADTSGWNLRLNTERMNRG